jgi:hypothetical protein
MITLPSSTNNSTFIFEQPVAYSGNNAVHQSVTVNNNVQQIVQQMQPMTISNNGTDQFSVRNGNVQQPIYFNNNIQPVGINRTFQQSIPINHNNQCINNEAQRPVVANNHVSVPVTVNNMNNNLHHSTIINNNVSFPVFPPANSVNRPVYVNRNNTFHKENV